VKTTTLHQIVGIQRPPDAGGVGGEERCVIVNVKRAVPVTKWVAVIAHDTEGTICAVLARRGQKHLTMGLQGHDSDDALRAGGDQSAAEAADEDGATQDAFH
jgi:hypothetical protein